MVIRALVQARLLGLKLLTLDACVVVSGNNPGAAIPYPLSATGLDVNDRSAMSRVMSPGSETSLAYAMRLLEQGIHTLEDSRCPHLSGAGLAGREQDGHLPPLVRLWPIAAAGSRRSVEG
jgi:hypothetical protein